MSSDDNNEPELPSSIMNRLEELGLDAETYSAYVLPLLNDSDDEEEQKEVKNYIKICKESSVNPNEIQVSILEQIMKGSTEELEPLHELVQKGMKDPSNIPGGGNKKFEFENVLQP